VPCAAREVVTPAKSSMVIEGSTVSISEVEAEEVEVAPVYYNLQGVQVENPSNGIYIVKRGNKVTKQYIK
jgi:hypothetical protein